jgi:hypothetical protein
MNDAQIDRLLADVPAGADQRHRRRVDGYAATSRRCEERISGLRSDLQRALRAVDQATAAYTEDDAAADEALRLACDLDALERVQPRVDSWLRVAIGAVTDDPGPEPFGEGPA